ncbi:hypothetical protein [Nostoc sp. KVJ20]|uniref:hypothetical protein n=1 Tax=Nostoc sp. KVJ20 TaxID=457944 RepID=UPI000ACD9A6A|nr:hypothetical protein [Nostoc sp. KVJ20]
MSKRHHQKWEFLNFSSGMGDKACRPDVSRSNRGRKKSTTALSAGQEAHTVPSGQCG